MNAHGGAGGRVSFLAGTPACRFFHTSHTTATRVTTLPPSLPPNSRQQELEPAAVAGEPNAESQSLSLRSKTVDVTEAPATGVPGGSLSRSVFAGRPNNGAAEPFLASFIDDFEPMAVEKATEERWRSESRRVRVCFTSLGD